MSKYIKWLGVGLGFTIGGPIGAILGYFLGSAVGDSAGEMLQGKESAQKDKDKKRKSNNKQKKSVKATAADFEVCLLILASVVIKADGKVDDIELDYVRKYFEKQYGKQKANEVFKFFNSIVKKDISTRQVSIQIREHVSHAVRLQLIHFLFGIAKADGKVSSSEEKEIHKIANYFYISSRDYVSIKSMFSNKVDDPYKILGIEKNVSVDEVKKAYRKMAKKYHPDRVRSIGEEHQKETKEKFQEIQNAYEKIKLEKNIK